MWHSLCTFTACMLPGAGACSSTCLRGLCLLPPGSFARHERGVCFCTAQRGRCVPPQQLTHLGWRTAACALQASCRCRPRLSCLAGRHSDGWVVVCSGKGQSIGSGSQAEHRGDPQNLRKGAGAQAAAVVQSCTHVLLS